MLYVAERNKKWLILDHQVTLDRVIVFALVLIVSSLIAFINPVPLLAVKRDLALKMNRYGINDHVNRWAVVIGISKYRDEKINKDNPIQFADRDATALYDFLKSPKGGAFDPNHTQLLTNEQATLFAIKRAFNDFLARAKEDDLVVIYFAGHGASDPENPYNLFLLPYDAAIDLIRTTAYPMDEINSVLQKYINAKRVVIIADACHSGGLRVALGLRGGLEKNLINKYVNQLTKSREGVATITASRVAQLSQEGDKWGGGHGVFTYYLLKGLEGEADGYLSREKDGVVTVAEAYEYARVQVATETNNAQTPDSGGSDIDTEIPLAVLEHEENQAPEEIYKVAKGKPQEEGRVEQEEKRLEEDIKDARKNIEETRKRIETEKEEKKGEILAWERLRKYIAFAYQSQTRSITVEDGTMVGVENRSILARGEIRIGRKFQPYLFAGATDTMIGEMTGKRGLSYGGGLKLNLYQSPAIRIDLGGEGRSFSNKSEKEGALQLSRYVQWVEYEGKTTITYAVTPGFGILAGFAFSKVDGEVSFKSGDNEAALSDISFNESDPLSLLFGVSFLYGHLQLDGEFRLTDMVKSEANGPQGMFSLGAGIRF